MGQQSWTDTTIGSTGAGEDGADDDITGSLIFDGAGQIIATQRGGGPDGYGKVFSLTNDHPGTVPWSLVPIYGATEPAQGININGPVVFDAKGDMFSMTVGGGTKGKDGSYAGVVFEITP